MNVEDNLNIIYNQTRGKNIKNLKETKKQKVQ